MNNNSIFPAQGLADPHALVDGENIYVICGHDESPLTTDTWRMDKWVILQTSDLISWQKIGEILPTDTYIGNAPNCWAGNLKKHNNKYYWFFSNKNISTGVLVANKPEGPYVDVLKKPLIDSKNLSDVPPYDPAVFYENGEHYIIVGSGHYYIAKLGQNLLSLQEKPTRIPIYNNLGEEVKTDDKPSIFKRNSIYYLIWGGKYATAKNLYGPYNYMGEYNPDCCEHNDFFFFKNNWYMVSEFPEISHFCRGVELAKIEFNEDGTLKKPQTHNLSEKCWDFSKAAMGFHAQGNTNVKHNSDGFLQIDINSKESTVQSSIWPGLTLNSANKIEIILCNESDMKTCNVILAHEDLSVNDWFKNPHISEKNCTQYSIEIKENSTEFLKYTMDFNLDNKRLKRLFLNFIGKQGAGKIKIKSINIFHKPL